MVIQDPFSEDGRHGKVFVSVLNQSSQKGLTLGGTARVCTAGCSILYFHSDIAEIENGLVHIGTNPFYKFSSSSVAEEQTMIIDCRQLTDSSCYPF